MIEMETPLSCDGKQDHEFFISLKQTVWVAKCSVSMFVHIGLPIEFK